jgi:hypothetical protein
VHAKRKKNTLKKPHVHPPLCTVQNTLLSVMLNKVVDMRFEVMTLIDTDV